MERYVFVTAIKDGSAILWCCLILAALFFGRDYTQRTWNGAIYVGKTRSQIFLAKMLSYYLVGVLMSVIIVLLALLMYAPQFYVAFSPRYIVSCLTKRLIMDIASIALIVSFPFLCKDVVKTMLLSLVFVVLFTSSNIDEVLHVGLYDDATIWAEGTGFVEFLPVLIGTTFIVALSTVISWLLFKRTEFN